MGLPSWKLAFVCTLACLGPALVQGTFLLPYQTQLAELHKLMKTEIGQRFRQNSALNSGMIEQELLPVLAEGTVAIRGANQDLVGRIASIRPNGTDGSNECWELVDSLVYLYTIFPQWDLQDCAYGGYSQWMRDDARERFYPTAHQLHRVSSEVVNAIIGVVSEDNPITEATEVEGRLDASLDHFNEMWIDGLQDLEEELERHNGRQQAIEAYMRECIDRTIATNREDVEYTVRYAEFFCV
uniref:Uncharacterized protein n=1 Tax=Anopheles atroparvus TaxID=41427 RepID=A0A182J7L6_ANOAO